ncbi:MAG: hypothetical protein OER96_07145 [Gammaproteobacteria bacterium]|nr:hypothetical protein [Gammaproteobacteria bacterium]
MDIHLSNLKKVVGISLACAALWPFVSTAQDGGVIGIANTDAQVETASLADMNKELQNAVALPTPEVVMPSGALVSVGLESKPTDAKPGIAHGWVPGSGPMTDPTVGITLEEDDPGYAAATGGSSLAAFISAPTNPLNGPYGPFQRWTWFGKYLTYPTSTIGKLFFDTTGDGVRNASCSASVIGSRVIATAGHCISNGAGSWYSKFRFCPSYNAGGVNATRGCWDWSYATTSWGWFNSRQFDRDYGCIVTAPTGTTVSNTVGSQTGWTGRAWNWGNSQSTFVFGYPANDGFPGYHIIAGASPEWYDVNMTIGDGQLSKYLGGDQHSGNSGGPWWLNLAHKSLEYPPVDSFSGTDPGQGAFAPYINAVYSHKRCASNCSSPPTATAGLFWNEMGAAEFRNTSAGGESEDIFAACYAND